MKMYQPGYAHHASEIAIACAVFFTLAYLSTLLPARRRQRPTDPAKIKKNLSNLRWASSILAVTFGQQIALNYSQAYDLPHQTSMRTWIIACCGCLGPGLGILWIWLVKEQKEPKPPEPEKPYYRKD